MPFVGTECTSGAIKNVKDLRSFARFMREEMGDGRRIRFMVLGPLFVGRTGASV